MTRDELLDKICPADSITDCCSGGCMFACDDCNVTLGHMLDEYEADIKAEVLDKFTNVLKEKHFTLCNIQYEEGYQYPSYIELNDIYSHIDEVSDQLKESEDKNEVN